MRFAKIVIALAVLGFFAGCSGDSHNSDTTFLQDPPPPGTSTLLASGGTSTSGTGGTGGSVYVRSYGAAIKVLKSGTVDASFNSSFTMPAPSFVTDHVVSVDMTVQVDSDDPLYGNLCTVYGDPNIYVGDGDGTCDAGINDTMVTGLTIDAGATLVLVDQGYGYAMLQLTNDLVINGTLTTDVNVTSGLDLEANIISVESGGKITVSATTMDWGAGEIWIGSASSTTNQIINRGTIEAKGLGSGNGGRIYFYANDLIVNSGTIDSSGGSSSTSYGGDANELDIYLNSGNNGTFHNSGALLAKGGNSSDVMGGSGGYGGYIYIDVPDLVVNTGTIDASGGTSDSGSGGGSGEVDVIVNYGDFYSSGIVRVNGGNGATAGGDSEAYSGYLDYNWLSVYVETAYDGNGGGRNGDIIISGTWEANGGDATNGPGGYGGDIYLVTNALGAVTINAAMSATGGSSTGSGSFAGASTYGIEIYSYNYSTVDPVTPGKIRIAGQYDLRGGNGDESGGSGGYLDVYSDGYNASYIGSDVELVGFPSLIMNGGDGANGGSGGSFQLYTYSAGTTPAGPITNEANISVAGGTPNGAVGTITIDGGGAI